VIGVDSRGTSYILEEGGSFGTSSDRVEITQVRVRWLEWCVCVCVCGDQFQLLSLLMVEVVTQTSSFGNNLSPYIYSMQGKHNWRPSIPIIMHVVVGTAVT